MPEDFPKEVLSIDFWKRLRALPFRKAPVFRRHFTWYIIDSCYVLRGLSDSDFYLVSWCPLGMRGELLTTDGQVAGVIGKNLDHAKAICESDLILRDYRGMSMLRRDL